MSGLPARLAELWLLGLLGALACLPPATIDTPIDPALEPAPPRQADRGECRALISRRSARGPVTHELRWDAQTLRSTTTHPRLILGTADELFSIRAVRSSFDPSEIWGDTASLSCEQDVIWSRRLPEGVSHPLVEAQPACVGTADGERVELESDLALLSAIGPLLGWRQRTVGHGPGPVGILDYQTTDLRDSQPIRPEDWLLEPSATMTREQPDRGACSLRDAPRSLARARGFALVWDARAGMQAEGLRLRVGYRCCNFAHDHGTCELDDPLPRPDPELAAMLPDEDGLLHSPLGCGSLGLDGSVRNRAGEVVGEHEVPADELMGVVFLPVDHPFEAGWLSE